VARHYKDWLKAYLEYSSYSEAPDKFHLWTGVSALAGAIRRKVWIDQAYFQWTPNFYIIFVAPPGIVSKSTTASIGMSILREVPDVAFGPQVITRQALITAMAASTTVISLSPTSLMPMSALTFSVSELGTLLDPQDRELLDILTGLWDGQLGAFEKVTKTQGNDIIENPWINIIACTTPRWLQDNVGETIMGGGLSSRIIWIYGEAKRKLVAYPGVVIPKEFHTQRLHLLEDLTHIASNICGEFQLTPEALDWGHTWYEKHYHDEISKGVTDATSGYVARKQTHLHKLAMVLQLSRSDELIIDVPALERAQRALTMAEREMHQVFDHIRHTPLTRLASDIVATVRHHGRMSSQHLLRNHFRTTDYDSFHKALQTARAQGRLDASPDASGTLWIDAL
jgi:hypothetical protein